MARQSQAQKLEQLKKDIEAFYSANKSNLTEFQRAQNFVMTKDGQWSERESAYYDKHRKPKLTANRLYSLIKQILSAQRATTRNIEIRSIEGAQSSPEQDDVIQKRIELLENIVRTIAYNSDSNVVYETAFRNACFGFGGWRIGVEYETPESFNQVIRLKRFRDPGMLYWDPCATDPLKVEGRYCGYKVAMSKDKFENQYNAYLDMKDLISDNTHGFTWGYQGSVDQVTVCHHYEKQYFNKTICLLSNGQQDRTCDQDEVDDVLKQLNDEALEQAEMTGTLVSRWAEVKTRKVKTYKIVEYVICGKKILQKKDWLGKLLPIVYVEGDSFIDDHGKQHVVPLTYFGEEPQKLLNIGLSNLADSLTRYRSERFKATRESIPEDFVETWSNPSEHEGLFIFNSTPEMPAGPELIGSSEIPGGIFESVQGASALINEVVGRNQTTLGQQGNEISGVAIDNRVRQDNESLGIHFDNLERAIEYTGKVILELVPKVYDSRRVMNVETKDGKNKNVMLNDPQYSWTNLEEGEYQITVKSGPSFALQQQEMSETLIKMVQMDPQLMTIYGDIIMKNLDLNDAQALADRIDLILDPRVLQMTGKKVPQLPQSPNPQAQMQRQAMQQQQIETQLKQQELQLQEQKQQADQYFQQMENELKSAKLNLDREALAVKENETDVRARTEIVKQVEKSHR